VNKDKHKTKIDFNYSLEDIEISNLELKNEDKIESEEDTNYSFGINIVQGVNVDESLIRVSCTFIISNENIEYGTITTTCTFHVENIDKLVDVDKKIGLPDEYADILNGICISTSRGVSFSQFKGTFLHDAIIPIVDVKTLNRGKPPKQKATK
jgi:hypothetical protein